jgi:hypothetical protein
LNEARRADRSGEQSEHPAARIQKHVPILRNWGAGRSPRKNGQCLFHENGGLSNRPSGEGI